MKRRTADLSAPRRFLVGLCGWIFLAWTTAWVCGADAIPQFSSGKNVGMAEGGGAQLATARQILFSDRFEQGLDQWKIKNYRNALKIEIIEDTTPGHCLLIHRDAPRTDTAFEITSRSIALGQGAACRLNIVAQHNLDLSQADGKSFFCHVGWLDHKGKEIGAKPFRFGHGGDAWYEVTVDGCVPSGAVAAVIHIGFDSPDLFDEYHLRIRAVVLSVLSQPPQYLAEGELISRPQQLARSLEPPTLQWESTMPGGTIARFQVRSAADGDGSPGEWTPFCGPDGTARSFFTASETALPTVHRGHRWFQYRMLLTTQDMTFTPVIRCVRIGADPVWIEDRGWSQPDTAPPCLVDYAPRRTTDPHEPLVFSLADNAGGVGVDRSTVEAYLDGQSITARLKRVATGTYRYDPPEPLAACRGLADLQDWSVMNYQSALTVRSGPPLAGGSPSITIARHGPKRDTAFMLVSPRVAVKAGATYRISCWARHGMGLRGAGGKGNLGNSVEWFDEQSVPLGEPLPFNLGDANLRWHEESMTAVAPVGAAYAVMRLGWDYPDLTENDEVALADPRFDGPHPAAGPLPNLHRVRVGAKDFAGNELIREWPIFVHPCPEKGVVTMRKDGVVLVDGKPFFPIGLYAVWKREHNGNDFNRCFAELREAGFNTAHTYQTQRGKELNEFYTAAERYGFKVVIAPAGGANQRDPRAAIRTVVDECRQPSLLAWYLADDTASHISAEELREVHRAIRDVDPYHVTVQADGVGTRQPNRSRYTDYVDSTDAFMPEIYPIRSDKACEVADVIRDMKTIAADLERAGRRAPIWAIIQDFEGWGWQRFPTNAEVRVMTYLAIIHGATGMTYYTYGGHGKNYGVTHDPTIWSNLKRIARELATLHDVLVEPDPPQGQRVEVTSGPTTDKLGYPSVSTRFKVRDGKSYLLAANSSASPLRVRIDLPKSGSNVEAVFENRRVRVTSNCIEDDFEPYGVHVYHW